MNPMIVAVSALGLVGLSPESFVAQFDAALTDFRRVDVGADVLGDTASGMIQSVASDTSTFVIRMDQQDATISIKWTETTTYTLDGNETTRAAALIVGRKAVVTHENGVATNVAVTTEG